MRLVGSLLKHRCIFKRYGYHFIKQLTTSHSREVQRTFQVPKESYQKIIEKLRGEITQDAFHVSGLLRNAIRGDVSMNVLTDGWPEFSVVICKVLQPTMSDKWSLIIYGQDHKKILDVIEQHNLVMKEHNTLLHGMRNCSQHILEQTFPQSQISSYLMCYLPDSRRLPSIHIGCHQNYILKPLRPEHAEYMSQFWPHFNSWSNKTNYLRYCIQKFPSSAAYLKDNPDEPVAWACTYEYDEMGVFYTMKEHREKGLALAVVGALCRSFQVHSPGPLFITTTKNSTASRLMKKLGFEIKDNVSYYVEIYKQ